MPHADANAEVLARLIPGARLTPLEGVGHGFWWEQPERCARLVLEHAGVPTAAAGAAGGQ